MIYVRTDWPQRPRPTRVHSFPWRPKARLLCPCCGGEITDWSEFAASYRAWRFGVAGDDAFMRHAGLRGPNARLPFPYRRRAWRG